MAAAAKSKEKAAKPSADELTIDQLARKTGMTARNIRAHQSRGLLPPPEVRARTGYYEAEHVARIRLIQDMQSQGFNLKAIERLLQLGSREGSESALAFERAILAPFGSEQPEALKTDELLEALGEDAEAKTIERAQKLRLIKPLGEDTWEIPSPTLLRAVGELRELGIPVSHALAVGEAIRKHTTSIAKEFVKLYVKDVLDPLREDEDLDAEHLATAQAAVERLRPLASEAVLASFGQVMTAAVERQLERELGR